MVKNKFWILEQGGKKLGTLQKKENNGWIFLSKSDNKQIYHTKESLFEKYGIDLLAEPKLNKDILCSSKSEARRMIKQSAVKVDNNKINNEQFLIKNGSKHTFQVGKHRHLIIDLA